ncbi:MAG: RDD family protein [Puniceicoccales bacterium]|jgi:uncharacterized RDD family membrane protein YckC|nr:RDD family protein [Puniceicoccales bacterium]
MPDEKRIKFIPATLNARAWAFNIDCLMASIICIPFLKDKMPDLSSIMPTISAESTMANTNDITKMIGTVMEPFYGVMIITGLVTIIYFVLSEILFKGSTIGKRIMKIKTVNINDPSSEPPILKTLIRSILKCVTAFYCIDITNITM